ncbi:MAG: hypothetical protein KGL39_39955 [Patescibacteria group bacterium]|nr:hypothetical protein [Patescibacteria group bacterium]
MDATFGSLQNGQYAFHVDSGFDHGAFRSYFLQRHPTAMNEKSPYGRTIVPIIVYEIEHVRSANNVIVLLSKEQAPREWKIDSRYKVIA